MSLVFSDTATKQGLVQEYERELGFDYGDVSGNPTLLAEFVAQANQAKDDATAIAVRSEGRWQFDDSTQTDYPIISMDLIAGQRDYALTTDQDGNAILDIYRVFVASQNGIFFEVLPVDVQTKDALPMEGTQSGQLFSNGTDSFTNGQNATGTPIRYDKLANAIFLDPVPSYNRRLVQEGQSGLKAYVNREATRWASTDTTKKSGFPGLFDKYFYLKPAMNKARRLNSPATYARIAAEVLKLEGDPAQNIPGAIGAYFSRRARDERARLTTSRDSNR